MTVEKAIRYIDEYLYCNFECDTGYPDCRDCGIFLTNADLKNVLQMSKEALEKQVAKPHIAGRCPACDANIMGYQNIPLKYCSECGQKLDWSKE